MIDEVEKKFVNTYIKKQYRERLLLELKDNKSKSPKRMHKAFKKFAHNVCEFIVPNKIVEESEKLTKNDFYNFAKNKIKDTTAYLMDEFDGKEMPIFDAIEKMFEDYGASILIYQQKFCFIKEETSVGSPRKIILSND